MRRFNVALPLFNAIGDCCLKFNAAMLLFKVVKSLMFKEGEETFLFGGDIALS